MPPITVHYGNKKEAAITLRPGESLSDEQLSSLEVETRRQLARTSIIALETSGQIQTDLIVRQRGVTHAAHREDQLLDTELDPGQKVQLLRRQSKSIVVTIRNR
jgi:hypothetical protein